MGGSMKRFNFIVAMFLMIVAAACILVPTMAFGADGTTEAVKSNIFTVISSALSLVFGGGLISKIRILSNTKKAIKEVTELLTMIRLKVTDRALLKEADEATEAVADVLESIKLKDLADKLRRAL